MTLCLCYRILSLYEGSQWDMEAMAELRERLLIAEEGNTKQHMATLSQVRKPIREKLEAKGLTCSMLRRL